MNCHISVGNGVVDDNGNAQEFDLTAPQCAALKPGKFIGQGNYASAYEVDGDPTKIVKFTADPADAKSSTTLMLHKAKGAVRVHKVVKLLGKKTYGRVPVAFYDAEQDDFVDADGPQSIYAIVAERLDPIPSNWTKGSLNYLNDRGVRGFRQELSRLPAKTFKFPVQYRNRAVDFCERGQGNRQECEEVIDEAIGAMEDVAHKSGVIPLDVHAGNWGLRGKKLALLDLGVSTGAEDAETDALAGMDETLINATVIVGIGIALWLSMRR